MEEATTFAQVGKSVGLKGITLFRYIEYMETRWRSEEKQQCLTGYAFEWAERFADGYEFESSDSEGQEILREIDKYYTCIMD